MHLLVNSVSSPIAFVFYDNEDYCRVYTSDMRGREFDTFLEELDTLCKKEGMNFSDLASITCVSGPAQFTSIRIVSLTLSTIARSEDIPLYSLDFFELAKLSGAKYPYLVNANKAEVVLKKSDNDAAFLCEKTALEAWEYFGAALASDFANPQIRIQCELDYQKAISLLPFGAHRRTVVEPYYLKKPNIT